MIQHNGDALGQRYGEGGQPDPIQINDTIDLLLRHRSVRDYRPDLLPEGALEAMVAAAQSASTSSNLQAWSVVAVENVDTKARLARLAGDQRHIHTCPIFLVWLADLARLERAAALRNTPAEGLDYFELFLLAAIDAALAAQNAVVAAESLGLGTVYIGGMRNRPQDVASELGLPARVFPVFGMCVGWPDEAKPAEIKPRLGQGAVLHRERYQATEQDAEIERYTQVMRAFYAAQGMRGDFDWARRSALRVAGPQALDGRDVLRQIVEQMGFPLR